MKKQLLFFIFMSVAAVLNAAMTKDDYVKLNNKSGEAEILSTLHSIISNHTDVGYDGLYEVYETSDSRSDGTVWDMYSDCTYRHNKDKCGSYSAVCVCYNREHSVPQSWWSGAHMKSDAFHVYPTDGKVNGQRSNYPFGECSGGTRLSSKARGKLGSSSFSGYSGTVFEPDDEYKGDFARSYFYMVACYYSNNMTTKEGKAIFTYNGGKAGLTTYGVNLLMKWHRQDPVSEKELKRNEAVFAHQHNRNPFIDYPCIAEYIWGTKKGQPITLSDMAECGDDPGTDPGTNPGGEVTPPVFCILPVTDVHANSVVLHWTDVNVTNYTVDVYQKSESDDDEERHTILLDEFEGSTLGKTGGYSSLTDQSGSIRLGSGSEIGSVEYSGLDLTHAGSVRVKAKAYGSDSEPTFTVKVGDLSQQFTATSDYHDYVFSFEGTTQTTITVSSDEKKKRVYLDEVEVVSGGSVATRVSLDGYPMAVGNVLEYRVTGLEPFQTYYFTVQPDGMPASDENIIFTEEGWQGFDFAAFPTVECLSAFGQLMVNGLESGSLVQIFATNGMLLSSFVANGDVVLSLNAGLYLVCVQKDNRMQSYKVIVR